MRRGIETIGVLAKAKNGSQINKKFNISLKDILSISTRAQ